MEGHKNGSTSKLFNMCMTQCIIIISKNFYTASDQCYAKTLKKNHPLIL